MSRDRAGERAPSPSLAAALAASAVTLVFLLPWWNRHLGLSLDGYMPLYGWKILHGEIPYRDFYLHLPPLQPLAEAALQAITGRSLLAVRVAGALGRIALAALTAAWLGRRFRPATAAFGAFAAVCLASSDDTEILDLYNQHALVGAIASGWLASLALDRGRRERWLWLASGAAAAAAFWTKQTVGVGAAVAVPLALAVILPRAGGERAALVRGGALFAGGWLAFSAPLAAWLATHGAFGAFVDQVFRGAAASKGPPAQLLVRPWVDPFFLPGVTLPAALGLGVAVLLFVGLRPRPAPAAAEPGPARLALATLALAAATLLAFPFVRSLDHGNPHDLILTMLEISRVGIFAGLFGVLLPAASLAVAATRRPLERDERELLLLCGVAEAAAAMHALSFPAGGAIALPCVAVVTALVLDGEPRWRRAGALRWPAAAALLAATLAGVGLREERPFDFAQWREPPVAESTVRSSLPELAGLRLSPGTVAVVDEFAGTLGRAVRPGEPLFTFSVYPIFNWLVDRPVPTFAILHWIDVTPDAVVDADLERILRDPPPAVVYQWVTDRLMKINELYFRNGQFSAMHKMQITVANLLDHRYTLVAYRKVPYYYSAPALQLWVRNDRARELGLTAITQQEVEALEHHH